MTKYTGGIRLIVIPAGYVGCAFWGGFFVCLSGSRVGATAVASMITFALLLSLLYVLHMKYDFALFVLTALTSSLSRMSPTANRYKPNKIVVMLSLLFSALSLLCIFIEWFVFSPIIEYYALFFGVFIGYYSVKDIYDDLVTRTAEGSDAVACHQALPCCLPRCVGVQFWIVAFAFQGIGLYLALVWMWSNGED